MLCQRCGVELDGKTAVCPYCGQIADIRKERIKGTSAVMASAIIAIVFAVIDVSWVCLFVMSAPILLLSSVEAILNLMRLAASILLLAVCRKPQRSIAVTVLFTVSAVTECVGSVMVYFCNFFTGGESSTDIYHTQFITFFLLPGCLLGLVFYISGKRWVGLMAIITRGLSIISLPLVFYLVQRAYHVYEESAGAGMELVIVFDILPRIPILLFHIGGYVYMAARVPRKIELN